MLTCDYIVGYRPFDVQGRFTSDALYGYIATAVRETCHQGVSVRASPLDGNPLELVVPGSPGASRYFLVRYSVVAGVLEFRAEASARDLSDRLRDQEIVHEVRQLTSRVVASWHPGLVSAAPVEPVFQGEGIA